MNIGFSFLFGIILAAPAYALDLGDTAYIYDGSLPSDFWKTHGPIKMYASVEIEDIRGKKARVKVIGHCFQSIGQGVGCWTIDFDENELKKGDLKWVDISSLSSTYKDKL